MREINYSKYPPLFILSIHDIKRDFRNRWGSEGKRKYIYLLKNLLNPRVLLRSSRVKLIQREFDFPLRQGDIIYNYPEIYPEEDKFSALRYLLEIKEVWGCEYSLVEINGDGKKNIFTNSDLEIIIEDIINPTLEIYHSEEVFENVINSLEKIKQDIEFLKNK